ncbi:MAG: hypothetical protein HY859_03920 [Caulobacterales bacterium]|nr:hypothetical protein [Caulobacterales bacterium]
MFLTPASQIGAVIMTLISVFAAWAGGRAQKVIALICFVAWIGSAAIQDRSYKHPQYATLVLDAVLMIVFVALALRWRQKWLTGVATFQVLTMTSHFAMIMDPRIWPKASITAYLVWSYMVLACLLWGGVAGLMDRRHAATSR